MARKKLNRLLPIVYSALTSFPYIEKDFDALTTYELLQAIVKKINEMVPFVNDLADGMEQVVTDLLTEWKNDGTLADIINEAILSHSISGNAKAQCWGSRMIDNVAGDGLNYTVQGAHCDGTYWYYALVNDANYKAHFVKMTMDGNIVLERTITDQNLGHCNGLSGGLEENTIVAINTNKVATLNSNTLELISINSLNSESNYCIATDYENQVYYIYNGNNIRSYDSNFNLVKTTYFHVDPNAEAGTIKQGCAYNPEDGRLYLVYSNPDCVYAVKLSNPEDIIVSYLDYEFWTAGEMEDASFVDGDFYFTSSFINDSGNRHIRFWYTNFYKGVKPVYAYASYITGVNMGNLIVDSDTNDFRPNGTSEHPFCRVGDAIEFGEKYIEWRPDSDFVINCRGNSSLGRVSIRNLKTGVLIDLNGVPSDVIFATNCSPVSFRHINIVSNVNNNPHLLQFIRCAKVTVDKGVIDESVVYTAANKTNVSESVVYIYDVCTPSEYESEGSYISTSEAIAPILIFRGILQTNVALRDNVTYTNGLGIFNNGFGMPGGYVNVTPW